MYTIAGGTQMNIVFLNDAELAALKKMVDGYMGMIPESDEFAVAVCGAYSQLDIARRIGNGDGVLYQYKDGDVLEVWDVRREV